MDEEIQTYIKDLGFAFSMLISLPLYESNCVKSQTIGFALSTTFFIFFFIRALNMQFTMHFRFFLASLEFDFLPVGF